MLCPCVSKAHSSVTSSLKSSFSFFFQLSLLSDIVLPGNKPRNYGYLNFFLMLIT